MDPYNMQAVSAVWQRVHQGRENDDLEHALSEAIRFTRRGAQGYLAMAKCSGNALFARLAEQKMCQAKKLGALYFLLFDCPPCAEKVCAPKFDSLCEAVRMAYQGEHMLIERYERMANSFPMHRELFCTLIREGKCHARNLQCFAERFLK